LGFRTITRDIDTTNPGGRLIFTVFGAIAEFERCFRSWDPPTTAARLDRLGRLGPLD
jgi:hypothetical protein